jgi:HAD superfamily hydrolase (TIGR01490 family)
VDAAFFDLDKTVISRSSMMAFAKPFCREGLVTRRTLARGACIQLLYVHRGAGASRLARIQRSVLKVTAGWPQAQVRSIVAEHLADSIDPITYTDASRLIDMHRAAGRRVYLVSAAPEEVVEPIGRHLGVDASIASQATIDEQGCYTGSIGQYAYGATKADLIAAIAARDDIDLAGSWSYSDSVTDAPMLEIVGHPVAVNPDRALRRLAQRNGWEIAAFRERGRPVVLTSDPTGRAWRRGWAVVASTAAVVAMTTTGGVTAWLWRRRINLHNA